MRMPGIFFLTLVFFVTEAYSQQIISEGGIATAGSGGINMMSSDHWGTMNNPAALPVTKTFSAGLHVRNRFQVDNLNEGMLAVSYSPSEKEGFGASLSYFSHEHYHVEQNWRFAYGRKLTESLYAGVNFDFFHRSVFQSSSATMLTGGTGIIFDITEELQFGASVFNPFGIQPTDNELIPPKNQIDAGLEYRFSEKLQWKSHYRYSNDGGHSLIPGVSYKPVESIRLNKAVAIMPFQQSFSIEFTYRNIRTGMAFKWHPVLGFDSHAGLDYFHGYDQQ